MTRKTVRERAVDLGMKAMNKLMEDPKRAERVAAILSGAQQGREALSRAQNAALHAAGVASRSDFRALGRKLSELRHQARELDDKLDALAARL